MSKRPDAALPATGAFLAPGKPLGATPSRTDDSRALAGPSRPGKSKARKPKDRLTAAPNPCVVLGIDPGATSGWAVVYAAEDGRIVASAGTCRGGNGDVVDSAAAQAIALGLPLVIVAEKWSAGGWASHTTLLGLGVQWGSWLSAIGATVPKKRIVRVYSQTWRSRLIGGPQRPSARWKADAQRAARGLLGLDLEPDAAEAALIALWGLRSSTVLESLPKKRGAR